MRTRNLAIVLTAAVAVYLVLLAGRGVALIRTGEVVPVLLGTGVLLFPVLGVWILIRTWRSGQRVQQLARRLEAEEGLPDDSDLPRRPSGRVDRQTADTWFERHRVEVEADPHNWRQWYRLAYAYDVAGDRRRARSAMNRALELEAVERE